MSFELIDTCGHVYCLVNGKLMKYTQTNLDDFEELRWMNPYLTIHGGATYGIVKS